MLCCVTIVNGVFVLCIVLCCVSDVSVLCCINVVLVLLMPCYAVLFFQCCVFPDVVSVFYLCSISSAALVCVLRHYYSTSLTVD